MDDVVGIAVIPVEQNECIDRIGLFLFADRSKLVTVFRAEVVVVETDKALSR